MSDCLRMGVQALEAEQRLAVRFALFAAEAGRSVGSVVPSSSRICETTKTIGQQLAVALITACIRTQLSFAEEA